MNYPSIIGIAISLFAILFLFIIRKKVIKPYGVSFWRGSLVFYVVYILILATVFIRWSYLESQLNSFDLDHNGFIEMEEYTDEYRIASQRVIEDTARNFAFLTGAILSLFVSFLFLSIDLTRTYPKILKSKNPSIQLQK